MNPIKALGLNDGGGLEASLAGLGSPPDISAPIIAIKSIQALSLAEEVLSSERAGRARPMRDERRTTAASLKLSCDDGLGEQKLGRIQDRSMPILASLSFIFN